MEYRSLGRTAVKVTPLPGLYDVWRADGSRNSYAIIDQAIDARINFLDTANVYSRRRNEGDRQALKRNGKRHQIVLATRCTVRWMTTIQMHEATRGVISSSSARQACAVCR